MRIVAAYLQSLKVAVLDVPMYRGHASDKWALECSAFRKGAAGIENEWQLTTWTRLARRFVADRGGTPLHYLVLAQHYGIPTNLLDWTTNPLIALFFASQENLRDDGKVISLNRGAFLPIEDLTAEALFEHRQHPLLIDTSTMNTRSTAQDSVMTLHARGELPLVVKEVFTVPRSEKAMVRAALGMFGVTPERVFADLSVAAMQFREGLTEQRARDEFMREFAGIS